MWAGVPRAVGSGIVGEERRGEGTSLRSLRVEREGRWAMPVQLLQEASLMETGWRWGPAASCPTAQETPASQSTWWDGSGTFLKVAAALCSGRR